MAKRMKDNDRREIREKITEWSPDEICGDLDEVLEMLTTFKKDHPKYHRFYIEEDIEYGYYDEKYVRLKVFGWRWETDADVEKRIAKAKKARKTAKENKARAKVEKEERERAELARLKEKYEEA